MDLRQLGWDPGWEELFRPHAAAGWVPARVGLEGQDTFRIVTAQGEHHASVAGRLLHGAASSADLPKVGDWTAAALDPRGTHALLHSVLPRRTRLARKEAGRDVEEQILAANVDVVFVVQALDRSFNTRRLERFLVMIHEGGGRPVVVLNKADLCPDPGDLRAESCAAAGDAPVLVVSARTGEGIDGLERFIHPGETVVFMGMSGVGKSSLINRLYGKEIQATLEVRESDAKGRHMTTWRELIPLPRGGLVIDTPGMREFHMWFAHEGLDDVFPDVAALALQCHFRACTHLTEKRCAVRAALDDGRLSTARFNSFVKLRNELQSLAVERREHNYRARRRAAGFARRKSDQHSDAAPDGAEDN